MPTPSRNDIYEAVIRKMVSQALEEQEESFEEIHGKDTDEELILYLQDCARELGYSPRYKEIIGWRFLEQHFGSWNEALQKANLIPAPKCPVTKLPRIVEETEKQIFNIVQKRGAGEYEDIRQVIQVSSWNT